MNKVILMGRPTREPEVRYSQGENPLAIARLTMAVDRKKKEEGQQSADFISCIAFGKTAEFIEKYITKGTKIAVVGRIQTGRYTNQEGQTVYTTEVVIEEVEFAESKKGMSEDDKNARDEASMAAAGVNTTMAAVGANAEGFMPIGGMVDELPF